MAAPHPRSEGLCCAHSGARQTLDEMDFERGEASAESGVVGGPRAPGPWSPRARPGPTRTRPLETPGGALGGKRDLLLPRAPPGLRPVWVSERGGLES